MSTKDTENLDQAVEKAFIDLQSFRSDKESLKNQQGKMKRVLERIEIIKNGFSKTAEVIQLQDFRKPESVFRIIPFEPKHEDGTPLIPLTYPRFLMLSYLNAKINYNFGWNLEVDVKTLKKISKGGDNDLVLLSRDKLIVYSGMNEDGVATFTITALGKEVLANYLESLK